MNERENRKYNKVFNIEVEGENQSETETKQ